MDCHDINMESRIPPTRHRKKTSLDVLADIATSIQKKRGTPEKSAKQGKVQKIPEFPVPSKTPELYSGVQSVDDVVAVSEKKILHKGGLQRNKNLDKKRLVLRIAQYKSGPWKGLWDIEPLGKTTVPQTHRTFHKVYELIREAENASDEPFPTKNAAPICEIGYAGDEDVGHPWFHSTTNGETKHVKTILVRNERFHEIWQALITSKGNVDNMQKTLNKVLLKTGFTQAVQKNDSTLFTFENDCWSRNAPSLLKGGSGSGSQRQKGRPHIVVA